MKTFVLNLVAGLLIGELHQASTFAAGWDSTFHDSFVNNVENGFGTGEGASCVATLGADVYVATASPAPGSGRLFRYAESTGTWEEVATFDVAFDPNVNTGVFAISGAQQSDNTKYLFVGGNFTSVTYGTNSSAANNVVALNVTSSGIIQLGSGTDGSVYALKALAWQDYSGGTLYPGMRCVVGGQFTTAGSVISKSIALWQQGSVVSSTWLDFSGGFTDDGVADLPKVNGLEATTSVDQFGQTMLSGMWTTGALRKQIGNNTMIHVAKWNGSAWSHIGQGFMNIDMDEGCQFLDANVYPSFYGRAACLVGSTVYFGGGISRGFLDASGTPVLVEDPDPDVCSLEFVGFHKIGTSESTISLPSGTLVGQITALAAKGSILYGSGNWWPGQSGNPWYATYSGSDWTRIDGLLGSPDSSSWNAASTSTNVYFVNGSCYRYTP